MANIFDVSSEKRDIVALMRAVRERLQAREKGGATGEEISVALSSPLSVDEATPHLVSDDLKENLENANRLWKIDLWATVKSTRPILGPAIIRFQQLVRRLTWWYTFPIFEQLILFNIQVVKVLNALSKRQHPVIEQYIAALDSYCKQLARYYETLDELKLNERLLRLERLANYLQRAPIEQPTVQSGYAHRQPESSLDYSYFIERYRGPVEEIRERQRVYAKYFLGREPVLDMGCGRGEFLEILREEEVEGYGIDSDLDMVLACQEKGLKVERDDVLEHLRCLPDSSLGGIFAAHLIEHLDNQTLAELVSLCHRKLRPDGVLVLETPNPLCLAVGAAHFWLDPSHKRPIHPETAKFLLQSTGFEKVSLEYRQPFPESDRLEKLELAGDLTDAEWRVYEVFNRNVDHLNELLLGPRDYAVIGYRR